MKEIDQIHDFLWRKRSRMVKEKNKAVTPRLAFPFCLKTAVKQGRFQKKVELHFSNTRIKEEFLKMFPV